ncbi:MAG TPA: TraR/DksA family transcriptional regulator [Mizugakiibacter sp.]
MPDWLDWVQEREQRDTALAIEAHARRPRTVGQTNCIECDADISREQQAMGAVRCVECQAEAEAREKHLRRR